MQWRHGAFCDSVVSRLNGIKMLHSLAEGAIYAQADLNDGPTCVMLHGWGRSSQDFAQLSKRLAANDIGTLRLDLPGFGTSPMPPSAFSSSDYADVASEAIGQALGGIQDSRFVLVGHSFGGRVAIQIAAQNPENLAELFISGVPLFRKVGTSKSPVVFRVAKRASKLGLVSNATMEKLRNHYGSSDYRNTSGTMREIFVKVVNEDYREQLLAIEAPTHLIWGQLDTSARLSDAQEAVTLLRNGDLVTIVGQDHFQPVAEPDTLVAGIVAAMDRTRTAIRRDSDLPASE